MKKLWILGTAGALKVMYARCNQESQGNLIKMHFEVFFKIILPRRLSKTLLCILVLHKLVIAFAEIIHQRSKHAKPFVIKL